MSEFRSIYLDFILNLADCLLLLYDWYTWQGRISLVLTHLMGLSLDDGLNLVYHRFLFFTHRLHLISSEIRFLICHWIIGLQFLLRIGYFSSN